MVSSKEAEDTVCFSGSVTDVDFPFQIWSKREARVIWTGGYVMYRFW